MKNLSDDEQIELNGKNNILHKLHQIQLETSYVRIHKVFT